MDDAGVVRLTDDLALVQTIDIFPPVVDDPYWFGRIAAANALSDIYAMGARPVAAVNFVGWPLAELGKEPLTRILRGCFKALEEADCAMAGGHSIKDSEVKFGLAVAGTLHPDRIVTNRGAQPGDALVLTKPLGIGCLTTAMRHGDAARDAIQAGCRLMARLNKDAAAAMVRAGAHAATDVTGYGLLGHACEMAVGSGVALRLDATKVPILEAARPYLNDRYACGGSKSNAAFAEGKLEFAPGVDATLRLALTDVQTSGGLLLALPARACGRLLEDLNSGADHWAARIGEVSESGPPVRVE